MTMNANFQQQQATGKIQTVIIDPSSTSETDEIYIQFAAPGPPTEPEEKDVNEKDKETNSEEDPGLNHDKDDDLSLNIEEDEPER